jgi:alcohol dehydrogenase YqhD (iron-dependent ADH family)
MAIENFSIFNPTRLHFGKGVVQNLGTRVKIYGKRVLLMYGKGSVKKYGYYDTVVSKLHETGLETVEFQGIKPNPVVDDVRNAVKLGRENNIDVIVALGGGSVIDSAKITALSIANNEDPWQFMDWKASPQKTIPLICVLTIAATGTEMNGAAVLQNQQTKQKSGYVNELNFPKESFLDPSFTTTVPANYTAYGIVDLIAHALEAFFGAGEPSVTDKITTSIIKDAMEWAPALLNNLSDYDLRANIMLDATLALNGVTSYGKKSGDWGVHAIGHELSFLYDTPHGATLSIAYPAWLKLQKDRITDRISTLGKLLFNTSNTDKTIDLLQSFFKEINSPVSLKETGINEHYKSQIVNQMKKNKITGMHHKLSENDYETLVDFMLKG